MEIVITDGADRIGTLVADAVARVLQARPDPTVGLATGSSPLPVYRELADRHRRGEVSFATATAFLLDEYVGLPPGHPQSYRRFIETELTDHVDLPPDRLHGPDVARPDLLEACRDYERLIQAAGGIDLQLLGIGSDGHIGFNEPTSSLASRTRLKTLTPTTRADNTRFFGPGEQVPLHVITQGLGTIREAGHLVLVAMGAHKAEAVAAAVEGPLTAMCPASVLQLHPHATVVLDPAAAGRLELVDYYRQTYEHKPPWQVI
jgi:glucosamine-6-phosphate deaminase